MSFASEFKEFALKGNVLDLAVGVIIGAAFGKIVDSIVKGLAVSRPKCNTRVIGLRAQLDESQPGFERRPATA